VTALDADEASSVRPVRTDGGTSDVHLRCFVTWMAATAELHDRLVSLEPDYDWAVVGVDGDGQHEVVGRQA
jgi:hypothetical protein